MQVTTSKFESLFMDGDSHMCNVILQTRCTCICTYSCVYVTVNVYKSFFLTMWGGLAGHEGPFNSQFLALKARQKASAFLFFYIVFRLSDWNIVVRLFLSFLLNGKA